MDKLITEAVKSIGDPFLIFILVIFAMMFTIIIMIFKMIGTRDKLLSTLTTEVHENGKTLEGLSKLISVLVYGRRDGRDN